MKYVLHVNTVTIKIFLAVKTEDGMARDVCKQLSQFREVTETYIVTKGPYDIIATIAVYSLDRYRIFAVNQVSTIPGVKEIISFLAASQAESEI